MPERDPLLDAVLNLAEHHREHEKFYAESPLHDAVELQRASRALKALAERWSTASAAASSAPSPYAGAPDLNDPRATEGLGILFMEGEAEPAQIGELKRRLASMADGHRGGGEWLARAMEASWGMAERLLEFPDLADLLGERHRIIANDWQFASLSALVARHLERAVTILERVDFSPAALRADLAGPRLAGRYLFSASELIDRAADLCSQAAVLAHDNERRWRVFRERVESIAGDSPS